MLGLWESYAKNAKSSQTFYGGSAICTVSLTRDAGDTSRCLWGVSRGLTKKRSQWLWTAPSNELWAQAGWKEVKGEGQPRSCIPLLHSRPALVTWIRLLCSPTPSVQKRKAKHFFFPSNKFNKLLCHSDTQTLHATLVSVLTLGQDIWNNQIKKKKRLSWLIVSVYGLSIWAVTGQCIVGRVPWQRQLTHLKVAKQQKRQEGVGWQTLAASRTRPLIPTSQSLHFSSATG